MKYLFALLLFFASITAEPVTKRHFLVTGCARSGTTYMWELLRASKIDVGHECLGNAGSVAWQLACDSNYRFYNWQFPKGKLEFDVVVHLVRDPIKVINSMYARTVAPEVSWEHAWRYILNCCPAISRNDPLPVKCAKYWYYWNLEAEKKGMMTLKIEELEERLDELSALIGYSLNPGLLEKIPKDINHRYLPTSFKITWDYLQKHLEPRFFHQLQQLASDYGYPIEDPKTTL